MLTAEVAEVIARNFPSNVASFLADNGLDLSDIDTWFAHPGGPRILEAFADSLRLPDEALDAQLRSRCHASATCRRHPCCTCSPPASTSPPASDALLFAVGPGVSAEFVLLGWPE